MFQVQLPKEYKDITTCEDLEGTLKDLNRTQETKIIHDIIFHSKQAILRVTMELAKGIFVMQQVFNHTPMDQGANARDTFSRKVNTTTNKSAKIRRKTSNLTIFSGF